MKDFFEKENLRELDRFAHDRVLVAFDYDGTLAPIVQNRERAVMRDVVEDVLAQHHLARVREDLVAAGQQRPILFQLRVRRDEHPIGQERMVDPRAIEVMDVHPDLELVQSDFLDHGGFSCRRARRTELEG